MPTLDAYDAVPYDDCPITESSPDYISVIGRLFGIETESPQACRVLELGCAAGGNLIPLAFYWPNSSFIGVELSKHQAAMGNALIDKLQLDNINIIHSDILQLDSSIGSFDYIIVHGVFSWVPSQVQDHILKLCRTLLRKNGIAYISYNTLPGWYLRMPVRDMMLRHSHHASTVEEKTHKSIEMLRTLSAGLPAKGQGSLSEQWLKEEVDKLLTISPAHLLHDYLEPNNQPFYFHDFMERVSDHGLQYLAEAHLYTMLEPAAGNEMEAALDKFDNIVDYEQHLDYLSVRHFRQSLLCHDSRVVERDLDIDKLRHHYVFTLLACNEEIDLSTVSPQLFTDRRGASFSISHPLTKAAIVALAEIYPASCGFDELLLQARRILKEFDSDYLAADADALLDELFHLYLSQGVRFTLAQRNLSNGVARRPQANALARYYSEDGRCCTGSAHHISIHLDIVDRFVISVLTGDHDLTQIKDKLEHKMASDADFKSFVEKNTKNISLESYLEQTLFHFAAHGLLVDSDGT
jgi:methyltransferase-like protein/2-polyprenyl-3-methyl-5-hydroxy-6-metoxy-1,4-benzoquinol methylase